MIVALQGQRHVRDISSPFVAGNAGQISADRHAALVQFKMQGTDLTVSDKQVVPVEAAVAAVQKSYPSLTIGEFGDASVDEGLNKQIGKDFEKAGLYSLPITLAVLLVAFGALVAAGLPLLLALTRRGGNDGPARDPEPPRCRSTRTASVDRAADRARRRRRLLDVLFEA